MLKISSFFAAGSVLLILVSVGGGFYKIFNNHLFRFAKGHAQSISKVIVENEYNVLVGLDASGKDVLQISQDALESIRDTVKTYLTPFKIAKIKIYSLDNTILFSTDFSVIGDVHHGSLRLARVWQGELVSVLKAKTDLEDLEGELQLDIDVIETYLPIRNRTGDIIGAIEIYEDVTLYREELFRVLLLALAILFLISLLTFGGLLLVIGTMNRRISSMLHDLELVSMTDPLTELTNRRGMLLKIEEEINRHSRTGRSFSIFLADLDFFKSINDIHGHDAGDAVLIRIAETLLNETRKMDTVCRWGGEEFLILQPETDFSGALRLAEKIRTAVEKVVIPFNGHSLKITLSGGVSTFDPSIGDINAHISQADKSLYQAKSQGRNQIAGFEAKTVVP